MIGGLITAGFTALLQWIERRARQNERYREREILASASLIDSFGRLLAMEREPEIEGPPATKYDEWSAKRNALLLAIETAPLDLRDRTLRGRLTEIHRALSLYSNALSMAGLSEQSVRFAACTEAFEYLGAFRRGEDLPAPSPRFQSILESVDEF
jgi:hypothetical protein